jgi:[acyl-carrier-protein] S-malonyltransferase
LHDNRISSLIMALSSVVCLDTLQAEGLKISNISFFAGYSVGQWTALFAAGTIDSRALFSTISTRAAMMDKAIHGIKTGMFGIMGLSEDSIRKIIEECTDDTPQVWISNVNCSGNISIAGVDPHLTLAAEAMEYSGARKIQRLPVSGAWHCPILKDAASDFGRYMQSIHFLTPKAPIIENVHAKELPSSEINRRESLEQHLWKPVLWKQTILHLIENGVQQCIEVGYGDMLSKFGFFIDRSCAHSPVLTSQTGFVLPKTL